MSTAYYEKIVQEDLNTGTSSTTIRNPGGGTLTATQVNLSSLAVGQLKASQAWTDLASISPNAHQAKDVTVTGAALGDFALASFNLDVQDLQLTATVTATNTVTCVFSNNTSAAIDLGTAGTLYVLVFHCA